MHILLAGCYLLANPLGHLLGLTQANYFGAKCFGKLTSKLIFELIKVFGGYFMSQFDLSII